MDEINGDIRKVLEVLKVRSEGILEFELQKLADVTDIFGVLDEMIGYTKKLVGPRLVKHHPWSQDEKTGKISQGYMINQAGREWLFKDAQDSLKEKEKQLCKEIGDQNTRYVYFVSYHSKMEIGNAVLHMDNIIMNYEDVVKMKKIISKSQKLEDCIVTNFIMLREDKCEV